MGIWEELVVEETLSRKLRIFPHTVLGTQASSMRPMPGNMDISRSVFFSIPPTTHLSNLTGAKRHGRDPVTGYLTAISRRTSLR